MKTIGIRNTAWAYDELGTGPAIVFVHGFPLDRRIWEAQLQGLSSRFRVITVDLKGFGASRSTEAFTIDSMADELAEFIEAVGAKGCTLAGLSMGGYVAFSLAARRPEAIGKLAIVCSKPQADTPEAREARQKMAQLAQEQGAKPVAEQMMPKMFAPQTYETRKDLVERLNVIMESCNPQTISNACFAMRDRVDRVADLPNLKMPVLMVVGEKDAIISVEIGQSTARQCRQGSCKVVSGAGHLAPMEQPEELNRIVGEFAAS